MVTTNVEKIRTFYQEEVATRIPFQTHPLKETDEYTKNLYCTMLTLILQYENEPMREQLIFLGRIVKGVELDATIQTLMQKAKTADETFAKEFYEQFAGTALAKNFIVDALVMTNCREKVAEKQLAFLVEVVDVLGVDEEEFEVLVQGAKQILSTSPEHAQSLYAEKAVLDYELLYYIPKDDSERNVIRLFNITLEELQKVLAEQGCINTIYVYNSKFSLEEYFYIQKLHDLYFINCEFTGSKCVAISTDFNVTFERCYFYHMHKHCITVSSVKALYIIACHFEHCGYLHDGSSSVNGGVIWSSSSNLIELYLFGNEFKECYAKTTSTSSSYYAEGAIFHGKVSNFVALYNNFIDCRCYSYYSSKPLFYFANGYREHKQYPTLLERFTEQLADKENFNQNYVQYNTFSGNNSPFC